MPLYTPFKTANHACLPAALSGLTLPPRPCLIAVSLYGAFAPGSIRMASLSKNLTVSYRRQTCVHHVDITFWKNIAMGSFGPNGAEIHANVSGLQLCTGSIRLDRWYHFIFAGDPASALITAVFDLAWAMRSMKSVFFQRNKCRSKTTRSRIFGTRRDAAVLRPPNRPPLKRQFQRWPAGITVQRQIPTSERTLSTLLMPGRPANFSTYCRNALRRTRHHRRICTIRTN